jgi:hypothetical protein
MSRPGPSGKTTRLTGSEVRGEKGKPAASKAPAPKKS